MTAALQFNLESLQLTGPIGTLPVAGSDALAQRFLMLVEGQCLGDSVTSVAAKYGFCRQRYYQLLADYKNGGLLALQPDKTGPKSNYRRTDQAVRQVLRYRFLDPDASPEVITQKLCQTHFQISRRSVHRIIADYGLQKKTLRSQPRKTPTRDPHAKRGKKNPAQIHRRPQRGKGGSPTSGS